MTPVEGEETNLTPCVKPEVIWWTRFTMPGRNFLVQQTTHERAKLFKILRHWPICERVDVDCIRTDTSAELFYGPGHQPAWFQFEH